MVLRLTEQAKLQINDILNRENNNHFRLRFGLRGGDCNGLSYSLGFDQNYDQKLDFLADIDGIPVTIRKSDLNIISGTTIDFKQNMRGGGFTIDNPNTVNLCGCESSSEAEDRKAVPENC